MSKGPSIWRRLGWRAEAVGYDVLSFLLRIIPVDWASGLGGSVLQALGPLSSKHRVVMRNLELAFPEKSLQERNAIARQAWNNLGRMVAEFPLMDRLTVETGRLEIRGLEHMHALIASGEPGVLVSGHLGNWEVMMAAIVHSGLNCRLSYRPANNPYVDKRIREIRRRYGVELFAAKGGEGNRELLAALMRGESVALLNDQRDNSGLEAPFFGRLVRSAPAPSRLAMKYGRKLYLGSIQRLKGARFRMTFYPPEPVVLTGDREADMRSAMTQINRFMEARIREAPAEWLWAHRRWPLECYEERDLSSEPKAEALASSS